MLDNSEDMDYALSDPPYANGDEDDERYLAWEQTYGEGTR